MKNDTLLFYLWNNIDFCTITNNGK